MSLIPLEANGPTTMTLVKDRNGEYYFSVRWSVEIEPFAPTKTKTLYTACAADPEAAFALALIILRTGKGLASPAVSR